MEMKQATGDPLVVEGEGWDGMSADEFKATAERLFGWQYARHLSGLTGMNRSTFQQYAKGGPKGRVVPRYMALMMHLLDMAAKHDLYLDEAFFDYSVNPNGAPVGTKQDRSGSKAKSTPESDTGSSAASEAVEG